MRLLSLTVRNYRVHRDLTVTFDPARNLIGGPNESGKSTLAEAAHRALFLRAKSGGKTRKEMVSTCHLGDPEVRLTFGAEGHEWTLEKRFAGPRGSARLSRDGAAALMDDEAETALAGLLKSEIAGGGGAAKLLPTLWSHLWVWQGSACEDPAGHASDHKDTLIQRLQQDGLTAVMQSANDQRVRERVAAVHDELFTATGKPKAGSKPELARARLDEATIALERAKECADRLEQAAGEHERAENEIAEADAALPGLREKRAATETKLADVEKLRRQEESRRHAWESAAAHAKELAGRDATILELQGNAADARGELAPAERVEASLVATLSEVRELSQAAELSQRQHGDAVRLTRLRHDLASASISAFEIAAEHQRLAKRAGEADQLRAEIATRREALSKLPELHAKELEALRKLDRAASQARASLDAMATGIELVAADLAVFLDGHTLAPGESRTLTDAAELVIGSGTRVRVRPGGGTSLADARLQEEATVRALTAELDRLTLRDLDHASSVLQQRQTHEQEIAQFETRWNALGGASLAAELATATAAHEAAKAEVERRLAALGSGTASGSLEAAREMRVSLQHELDLAEQSEAAARQRAGQLRERLEAAAAALQKHRDQTAHARQALRDLETKLRVLEESHGAAAARQASLVKARETEETAARELAATRQALADLSPDVLADDFDRFSRAITQQEGRRRDAENRRLVARDRLTLDGTADPHADLSHARARHEVALETHHSEQRRARAIAELHQLFSSSRETIDRALVQPLADRISGYLQCLFGPAAEARVNLSGSGIEGLELLRGDGSTFHFATLSGGAKEQVAAAVRLAMAEILAAGHDGSLPLVFDDAFAYTDPERVQSLQRMLNLAALRGLQVIVLTCTPGDYSAFGASEIRLG